MKSLGKFTLQGTVESLTWNQIRLFDGSFSTAYRVTKFVIVTYDPDNSGLDLYGTLATEELDQDVWNFADNRQIGWASMANFGGAYGPSGPGFELINRDNLIVEDLWLYGETNAATAPAKNINYYIEMEKFDVGLSIGAYSMVRNSSQNMPSND